MLERRNSIRFKKSNEQRHSRYSLQGIMEFGYLFASGDATGDEAGVAVAAGAGVATGAGRAPLSSFGFSTTFLARKFSTLASLRAIA